MMYQEKSGKGRRIKVLALVPAVAVALAATSIPQVQAAMSTIANSATSVSKVTENPANSQTSNHENPQVVLVMTDPQVTDSIITTDQEIKVIGYGTIKKDPSGKWDSNTAGYTPVTEKPDTMRVRVTGNAEPPAIFVDGKEIPYEDMNKIKPTEIEAIEVDQKENKIYITLKK